MLSTTPGKSDAGVPSSTFLIWVTSFSATAENFLGLAIKSLSDVTFLELLF
jgi:hypothetical protein